MKKLFQVIGILSLMGISFFYTEKTLSVVKEYDTVMINIKQNISKYKKESVNATINNDTIIPGISGMEIDIHKSYSKMKKYGNYNESLIVLKKTNPKISLKNNIDKYIISGNKTKRNIALIFKIKDDDIDSIISILDKKKVKGNFIFNDDLLHKNTNLIPLLIREKHIIGIIQNNDIKWSSELIKKIGKQKDNYCIFSKKDDKTKELCKNNLLIIPNIIINKKPYENTKKIRNGNILLYEVNDELIEELPIIINYIKSKGYKIVNLEKLLEE